MKWTKEREKAMRTVILLTLQDKMLPDQKGLVAREIMTWAKPKYIAAPNVIKAQEVIEEILETIHDINTLFVGASQKDYFEKFVKVYLSELEKGVNSLPN